MPRVQVAPLSAPERLQPSGIQSDTFVRAAQPPIDNNLENLSKALGQFSQTLSGYHKAAVAAEKRQEAEKTKAFVEQAEHNFNLWHMQRTSTEQLEELRAGRAPYQADVYYGARVDHHWGTLEAKAFAAQLQKDLHGADAQRTLDPNFKVEDYVKEKMAKFVEDGRFKHSPYAIKAFRAGADTVLGEVGKWHQDNVGRRNIAAGEQVAADTFDAKLKNAVALGLSPEDASEYLREEWKNLGPRVKGGALDLQYSRLDELQMTAVERFAVQGKREAEMALQILDVDRKDPDTGQSIGSLKDNARLRDKVEAIQAKASKTIATADRDATKQTAEALAAEAVLRQDGSIHSVQDLKAQFGSGVDLSLSSTAIKEKALSDALSAMRAQNKGVDLRSEIVMAAKSNLPHPEIVPHLQGEATAALTLMNTKGKEGEAIERLIKAGDLYAEVSDVNMAYAKTHVKERNSEIFETYVALVRSAKMPPAVAAQHVLNIYAQTDYDEIKKADAGHRLEVEQRVKALDFNGFFGLGGAEGSWMGDALKNGGEVRRKVVNLATVLMRARGLNADDALKEAAKRVEGEALWINGRAIFGVNGLSKGDEPAIEAVIKRKIALDPESFKRAGITEPSQVTIVTNPNGEALLINKETGWPVRVFDKGTGQFTSSTVSIRPKQVQAAQAEFARLKDAHDRATAVAAHTAKTKAKAAAKENGTIVEHNPSVAPYAPDVLLRKLFKDVNPSEFFNKDKFRSTFRKELGIDR